MSDVLLVNRQEPSQLLVPVEAVKADLVTKTGTIMYVPLASTTHPGIVQVGDYLTITGEGVLSLADSATLKEYLDINDKVDKVEGKGLSTNDYTTEDKNKLAGLENYDDTVLSGRINNIELVIPTGVSSDNKLTSESYVTEFVNSSIATNTATFRGTYETVNDLPNTTDIPDLKSNDYAFVIDNGEYKRYKYNGSWTYEYTLNNSSYTASQWAAINSGITSEKVALIVPVNNSTITFTQGGVTKGSIALNQSSDATIALDAAGGGSSTDVQVDGTSQVVSGVANLLTVNNNYNSSTNKLVTANDLIGKLDKLSTKNNVNCEIDNSNAKLSIECYPTSNRILGNHLFVDNDSFGLMIISSDGQQANGAATLHCDINYSQMYNGTVVNNHAYTTTIEGRSADGIKLTYEKDDDDIAQLQLAENAGVLAVIDPTNNIAAGVMIGDLDGSGELNAASLLYMQENVVASQIAVNSDGVTLGVGDIVNNIESIVLITPTDFTWNGKTIATVDQIQSAVQSDWNQSDSSALDYIKNKPSIPSISGLESTTNKVTSLSSGSTDTQYPSAKLVYDELLLKQDVINVNNKLDYSLLTNTPTLGSASTKDVGTSSGNVPILDSNGKLSSSVLPAIAITDTFVVSTEAAMLALTAEVGDVCVRTDLNKTYILKEDGASTLSHWQEMLTPTTGVTSVNGQTGAVTLTIPTKTSDLINDSGYLTSYTETDPTVPNWAKQSTKPTYSYSEITNTPDLSTKQDVIDASHKLSADFVDDTSTTNKFVTAIDKSTWNGKQDAISDLSTIRSGAAAGATAVQDVNYVHTDNNYTNEDKAKVSNAVSDVQVDDTTVVSNGVSKIYTKNGDYNASTNKLVTENDNAQKQDKFTELSANTNLWELTTGIYKVTANNIVLYYTESYTMVLSKGMLLQVSSIELVGFPEGYKAVSATIGLPYTVLALVTTSWEQVGNDSFVRTGDIKYLGDYDNTPIENSTDPVTSGGVYSSLLHKTEHYATYSFPNGANSFRFQIADAGDFDKYDYEFVVHSNNIPNAISMYMRFGTSSADLDTDGGSSRMFTRWGNSNEGSSSPSGHQTGLNNYSLYYNGSGGANSCWGNIKIEARSTGAYWTSHLGRTRAGDIEYRVGFNGVTSANVTHARLYVGSGNFSGTSGTISVYRTRKV